MKRFNERIASRASSCFLRSSAAVFGDMSCFGLSIPLVLLFGRSFDSRRKLAIVHSDIVPDVEKIPEALSNESAAATTGARLGRGGLGPRGGVLNIVRD